MKIDSKAAIQYAVSFLLAGLLLWYVFNKIDFSAMLAELKKVNYAWVIASMAISLLAHISRAYRWNLLLEPLGFKVKLKNSAQAVCAGYLANLAFPRLGEVTRCGIINKTDNVPVSISIGSVITERLFDVLAMIIVFLLCFIVEFERFNGFFVSIVNEKFSSMGNLLMNGYLLVFILLVLIVIGSIAFILYLKREIIMRNQLVIKLVSFIKGLLDGIMSITKLKRKGAFIGHTLFIWVIYYLMIYLILFSIPDTSQLPLSASLVALALGSLGMAAPVQGGIGTYHIMISAALLIYGIPQEKGLIIATILHTSQLVAFVVFGGISMLNLMLSKTGTNKPEPALNN